MSFEKTLLIYKQIAAAINDEDETFVTVYYERGSGATTAAVTAAREFGATLVTCTYDLKRTLEQATNTKWVTVGDIPPLASSPHPFIADCLLPEQLKQLKALARDRGSKVIAIKPVSQFVTKGGR